MKWKKLVLYMIIIVFILVAYTYFFIGPSNAPLLTTISALFSLHALYFLIPLILALILPFILESKYSDGKGIIFGSIIAFIISVIAVYTYPGELGFGFFAYLPIFAISIILFVIGIIVYLINGYKNSDEGKK